MVAIILVILGIIGVVVKVIRLRWEKTERDPGDNTDQAALIEAPHDLLIWVRNVDEKSLKEALDSFCRMYNYEYRQVQFRVWKRNTSEFAITFPYPIGPRYFAFLVNYLHYPLNPGWKAEVTGWANFTGGAWNKTSLGDGEKLMVFLPENDPVKDAVFMTRVDDRGFEYSFGSGIKELHSPVKRYKEPPFSLKDLEGKDFEDFT